MKILFAPLEGITGYTFRNVHHQFYGGIAAYYTPFLTVRQTRKWKTRERKDIDPSRNAGVPIVPQVLTNHGEDFLWAAENLASMGYDEINLNLGCPSATVVTKHKGSGFLEDPEALDCFFDEIFTGLPAGMEVSVKTRIGLDSPEEMEDLLPVFNRYPLKKLIVHPRTRQDFYTGPIHMQTFQMIYEQSTNPVVYNGDIVNVEDALRIISDFPKQQEIMIGRGLIRNPALGEEIVEAVEEPVTFQEKSEHTQFEQATIDISKRDIPDDVVTNTTVGNTAIIEKLTRFRHFHDALLRAYQQDLEQDSTCLMKMKELWDFWASDFQMSDRDLRKIKKARTIAEYRACLPF